MGSRGIVERKSNLLPCARWTNREITPGQVDTTGYEKKKITFTRRKYKSIGLVNIWLRWRDIYFCSPSPRENYPDLFSLLLFFFFFKFCFHTMQTICAFFTRRARMLATFFHYFRAGRVRLCLLELAHLPFQVEIKRDREICVHARRSFNTRVSFLWEICCNLSDICHNMYIHAAYYFSHFQSICIFLTHVAECSILNELWRISYWDARGLNFWTNFMLNAFLIHCTQM